MEGLASEPAARPSTAPAPPAGVARAALIAALALAVVAWAFAGRPFSPSLLAAFLLVYFPVVSLVTPTEGLDLGDKTALYRVTAAMLLVMGGLSAWAWWWLQPSGWSGGLLARPAWADLAVQTFLLLGALLLVMALFHFLGRALRWRERSLVRRLMPENPVEKRGFVFLSLAAGMGEEVAYRAFAPVFLIPLVGSYLVAAVPCALAFGCLHMYQGIHGVVRTGVIGLVLALGVAVTGNLWPAVAAHALLNIVVGLFLGDVLLGDGPAAVDEGPASAGTTGDPAAVREAR